MEYCAVRKVLVYASLIDNVAGKTQLKDQPT